MEWYAVAMDALMFALTAALFRVGAFLVGITVVYYLAVRWAFVWWRGGTPRGRVDTTQGRVDAFFRHPATGALLGLTAITGILCMAYGFTIAPNRLRVTTYTIETPKLPQGERVRIVHIADLHARENGPREQRLPQMVRELKPDLVLNTGDLFATHGGYEDLLITLFKSWEAPHFICYGNIDRLGDFHKVITGSDIKELNGDTVPVIIRNARLTVSGFSSASYELMPKALKHLDPNTFNIVLHHQPAGFAYLQTTPADLMLAGHTHGGQVCIPLYGALVTLDKFGKRWEGGHYIEDGRHLVVSRGIGCEPFASEVRFWCPPELVVIDVVGTAPAKGTPP